MSKTPSNLSSVEQMALAQCVKIAQCNDDVALPENTSQSVDFTVRIKGEVSRGAGSDRRATNRARTSNSMIMLLVASGVTRNHSPGKIIETWREIGSLDKVAFQKRYDSMTDDEKHLYDECLALFETEIVGNLPLIPSKGGVKFKGTIS